MVGAGWSDLGCGEGGVASYGVIFLYSLEKGLIPLTYSFLWAAVIEIQNVRFVIILSCSLRNKTISSFFKL